MRGWTIAHVHEPEGQFQPVESPAVGHPVISQLPQKNNREINSHAVAIDETNTVDVQQENCSWSWSLTGEEVYTVLG